MMPSIHAIQNGAKVRGVYFGAPFTGTVTSHRPHTMNRKIELFWITLDAPIDVLGLVRNDIHTAASDDRAALIHYHGGMDDSSLEAV